MPTPVLLRDIGLRDDYDASNVAITVAWKTLIAETGRLATLTWLP